MKILNRTTKETFLSEPERDLLSAALESRVSVRHACRRGVCGACKAQVLSGTYTGCHGEERTAPAEVLLCQTFARSDLELAFEPGSTAAVATRSARIEALRFVSPDVAILTLDLIDELALAPQAGQFMAIRWHGDRQKLFSVANVVSGCSLELHIRRVPGGEFTEWLFEHAEQALGALLGLEGPYGDFHWQSTPDTPVVLLATGTGFAPIKALLDQHLARHTQAPVYLYWGGRSQPDLYLPQAVALWQRLAPAFHYRPVLLSDQQGMPEYARCGDILQVLLADFPSLNGFDVYACGAPLLIAAARQALCAQRGLDERRFFSDPFVAASLAQAPAPAQAVAIHVQRKGQHLGSLQAQAGITLHDALSRAGFKIARVCGGKAACGTCLIEITGQDSAQAPMGADEADLLECLPEAGAHDRLACQTVVSSAFAGATITLRS